MYACYRWYDHCMANTRLSWTRDTIISDVWIRSHSSVLLSITIFNVRTWDRFIKGMTKIMTTNSGFWPLSVYGDLCCNSPLNLKNNYICALTLLFDSAAKKILIVWRYGSNNIFYNYFIRGFILFKSCVMQIYFNELVYRMCLCVLKHKCVCVYWNTNRFPFQNVVI